MTDIKKILQLVEVQKYHAQQALHTGYKIEQLLLGLSETSPAVSKANEKLPVNIEMLKAKRKSLINKKSAATANG